MLLVVRTIIWSSNFFLLRGPVGRPCGTWMHYAMRDVKDMGQQMGYRSLEWNWPKEAMNIPIWAGIVDGAKLFYLLVNSSLDNS